MYTTIFRFVQEGFLLLALLLPKSKDLGRGQRMCPPKVHILPSGPSAGTCNLEFLVHSPSLSPLPDYYTDMYFPGLKGKLCVRIRTKLRCLAWTVYTDEHRATSW